MWDNSLLKGKCCFSSRREELKESLTIFLLLDCIHLPYSNKSRNPTSLHISQRSLQCWVFGSHGLNGGALSHFQYMKFSTSGQASLTLCLLLLMADSWGGRRRWLLTVPMFVLSRTMQYKMYFLSYDILLQFSHCALTGSFSSMALLPLVGRTSIRLHNGPHAKKLYYRVIS